jgi:chitinase
LYISQAFAAKYWVQLGAPPAKLNIGLALYGRSFTLKNAADHGVGSAAKGGGKPGTFTQEEGYLSFYEVQELTIKLTILRHRV